MASAENDPGKLGASSRLARRRGLTGATMVVERLWPLALPVLLVVGLFLVASWFGLFRMVPDLARIGVVAAFGVAALVALYPLRFYRQPTRSEIDRRIEAANHLLHAPVLTQSDRLTGGDDPFANALWREHQRRMADQLGNLSGDLPNTRVPERDPWGMRAVVALLLVVAFAFSASPYGGRLLDAFQARPGVAPLPPRIDAWVTPPPYTGKAPIFLTADANRDQAVFTVPAGSDVAVRVTGGSGAEGLGFTDPAGATRLIEPVTADPVPDQAPPPAASAGAASTSRQFASKLSGDGMLTLKNGDAELGRWMFSVTPDNPPAIRFTDEPKRAANGGLELGYEVEDDYGVASGQAVIKPAATPSKTAHPLYAAPEMPLSLPRRGDKARKTVRDLSEHPWAGADVDVTLKAVDGAGQEGFSEPKPVHLPERRFTNPVARALIEQRRILAMDATTRPAVLELIDAITLRPEDTFETLSTYLGIMSARTRLQMARTDDDLRGVVDYLWEIAVGIEDGALSTAEKRLKQAQQALKDALEKGASDEEIEQRMAELREAMNEFLKEFAERARQNPNMAQQMPQDGQELRQQDLERMMDQIEDLAKSGQKDQAQQLLSQLEQMMNNLQAGRGQQQQGGGKQQNAMRQQMDKLGEIMRRQQQMMNETFRLDQMQRGQQGEEGEEGEGQQGQRGQQGQGGQQGGGGQGGQPMSPQEFADALQQLQEGQGQLQKDLQGLMDGLRGMGIQPGEGFGQAGEAMGRAEGALGQSEGERAAGEQGSALEALRRGAQDMMKQMQQAQQGQEGEGGQGQPGGRQRSADRDPLGRPRATTGPDFGNSVEVPDVIDAQRARQILDEIRKRLGNALSPQLERDYLERLLDLR